MTIVTKRWARMVKEDLTEQTPQKRLTAPTGNRRTTHTTLYQYAHSDTHKHTQSTYSNTHTTIQHAEHKRSPFGWRESVTQILIMSQRIRTTHQSGLTSQVLLIVLLQLSTNCVLRLPLQLHSQLQSAQLSSCTRQWTSKYLWPCQHYPRFFK